MCITPLYILRKCEHCDYFRDAGRWRMDHVPCGKCFECLKKRQNDFCVRIVTELNRYQSAHFVTLTYSDDALPVASSLWIKDDNHGCTYKLFDAKVLDESPFLDSLRSKFAEIRASHDPRYIEFPLDHFDGAYGSGTHFYLKLSPSLHRRDFRYWLKSCRVAYLREFGEPLPDFKVVSVGEYGSRTCRPHYHALFMGLTNAQIHWMCGRWIEKYGIVDWKNIVDSHIDKFRVARYISKYMTKGSFASVAVTCGDVEKGRVCTSKYLGRLASSPCSYYYCYDLFGAYDPNTLRFVGKPGELTLRQQSIIFQEMKRRMCVYVPGFDYPLPLPQSWKRQIYYNKYEYKDAKVPARYVPKKIFKNMCEALRDDDMACRERELKEFAASQPPGTPISEIVVRFNALKKSNLSLCQAAGESAFVKFYSRDSF